MGNSTYTLENLLDIVAGENIPDPRNLPSGYGDQVAMQAATNTMAALLTEQFNWKFNRAVANPIYTNGLQQDYPQPAQSGGLIGWGEDCDICDINNTQYPKPLNWDGPIKWRRNLTRTSIARWRPGQIAWMYNVDLTWGTWPGAATVYHPLVTTGQTGQNPLMNFIDKNGNYLILTTFGTTGGTAPFAAANATEGTTVTDNTCVWTVVSGTSQGFRLDYLPNAAGPTYQITPIYQLEPPAFITLGQLANPIPNSYIRHFLSGLEAACFKASPNPGDKERGKQAWAEWLGALTTSKTQANKEQDVYGLIPATSVVECRWNSATALRTADQPF